MRKTISLMLCSMIASSLAFVLIPGPALGTDVDSDVTSDTVWDEAGSPFVIMKTIHVAQGSTLTVEAGARVEFDGFYSIVVDGTLIVNGTMAKEVVFTSGAAFPSAGDWNEIKLAATSSGSVFRHASISYGRTGLYAEQSSFEMTNSTISHTLYKGIDVYQSFSDIRDSTVSWSNIGIKVYKGSLNILDNLITQHANGLDLTDSDSLIQGNEIRNNGMGIVLNASFSEILDNEIFINEEGIVAQSGSHVYIEGNEIYDNVQSGIWCIGSDAEVFGNEISDNAVGVEADGCSLTASENIIRFNFVGIGVDDGSALEISNSSVQYSGQYSYELTGGSYGTSINSSYEPDKVSVDGTSTLVVRNYLTVRVYNKSGSPVEGVAVSIRDADDGGTVYTSFTGENGLAKTRLVTDRIYSGSSVPSDNPTHVELSMVSMTFADNPRDVDMSTSHVETFFEAEPPDGDGSDGDVVYYWYGFLVLTLIVAIVIFVILAFLWRRRQTRRKRKEEGKRT